MKIYIVSGLGADYKVLSKLQFPKNYEPVFIDWLMPQKNEDFYHFVARMAEKIDETEPFCLLGYSFGGIIVQEINKIKRAQKVIILGSIKSHKEKSKFIKAGEITGLPKYFPEKMFSEKSALAYGFVRRFFDPKNPKLMQYFAVRDAHYLKWSVEKISAWRCDEPKETIQILGDRDLIFPIKNSKPDYIIKNGTHLFPATKAKEVSKILAEILA